MTVGNRLFRLFLGILTASLVVSLAWVLVPTFIGQGSDHPSAGEESRPAAFANWPTLYQELDGNRNYVVSLSYFKGLSEAFTDASGRAVVNFETGKVSVKIEKLPVLEDGSTYEVLLVDNQDGPGNSVALDGGPNGDDVISLGLLDVHRSSTTLEKKLDIDRLERFEIDMILVRR